MTTANAHYASSDSSRTATEAGPHRQGPTTPVRAQGHHSGLVDEARKQKRLEQERHIRSLAAVVSRACVEAELGLRPARQLAAWLDLPTYGKMMRRADLAERTRTDRSPKTAPRTLQVRCLAISETVYEASATVICADRARALALRIERHRARWKVTAIEMG